MMKRVFSCLLILFVVTACQPANPQADSVSEDKNGKSTQNQSQGETKGETQTTENEQTQSGTMPEVLPVIGSGEEPLKSVQNAGNYRNYYEIYVGSFYDSDGDGIGDLNGVRQKLNYIADMGFTGIWLMPIHPSDTYHKYDVKDYYAIDPAYGSMQDMEALIAECRSRDIALILDFVANHTADNHPWFTEAIRYLQKLPADAEPKAEECPYIDYYHFTKDSTKGKSYHLVDGSNWYYEGVFWGEMPDLNVDHPAVRQELKKIMDFWLDKGVSGFRLDAVKEFHSGKTAKNIEFLDWLVKTAKAKKEDVYLVGEAWSDFAEIAEYYKSGLPSLFNFALATGEGKIAQVVNGKQAKHTAKSFAEAMVKIDESFSANNPDYMDGLFVANHDNVRMANYFKGDLGKIKMAAGMYLTMTGVSFTYYGEEIGMVSSGTKDENKRTAMVWQKDGKGQTRNPENADEFEQTARPVAEQEQDPDSLIRYYQKALHLRQQIPALAAGKVSVVRAYHGDKAVVITKQLDPQEIIVVYNISAEPVEIDLTATDWADSKVIGYLTTKAAEVPTWQDRKLRLSPYSIVIMDRKE